MASIATVASIVGTGTVYAVNALGVQRIVKAGDVLEKGETLRTVGNATVELLMDDGNLLAIAPDKTVHLDDNVSQSDTLPTAADSAVSSSATSETIIQALERGTDLSTTLDATALGLDGGGGGGNSFVQLLRISEGVDAQSYNFNFSALGVLPITEGIGVVGTGTNTVAGVTASITVNPIAGDGIINAKEALSPHTTINGTVGNDVKVGDTVTILVNGHTTTTTVTTDDSGKRVFSAEVATSDLSADSTVDVSVTTSNGDASATSTATTHVVVAFDTVINQPVLALVHDTANGADNTDGVTNNAALNISAAEVGSTRVITVDGQVVSSYDPATLKDGAHTVNVTDTDVAGNSKSAELSFTLDTQIAQPTIGLVHDTANGADNTDGVTNNAALNISAAEVGSTRVITVDGQVVSSYDPATLKDGAHTVSVTDTDVAGNSKTAELSFTLDTQIAQPTIGLVHDTASGADNTDGVTNNANLNISALEVGSTRVITVDGQVVSSYDPATLKDGAHTVNVTDTDVAGNSKTAELSFTLDTQIAQPTIGLVHDTANGADNTDGVTNNAALNISAAEVGSTRVITVDGQVVSSYDPATLKDGAHTVSVTDTDVAGNSKSAELSFTLDTQIAQPTIGLVHDTANGADNTDGVTNNAALNISAAEVGSTRVITVDGQVVSSYDPATLKDGAHTVSVTDTDVAGNSKTAELSFTLDTQIAQPTLALVHDTANGADNTDGVTNNANLNISALEVGSTRVITVDGQVVSSYDPATLKDGAHTVNVTDTDVAGNSKSASLAFTLDTKAEATISIDPVGNDLITAAEAAAGGNVTVTGTVGGDAKVNDVVTVTVNSHETTGVVTQGPNGLIFSASVAVADLVIDKTLEAKIMSTDAAGNGVTVQAFHDVKGESVAGNDATAVTEDLAPVAGLLTTSGAVSVVSSSGLANAVDPTSTTLVSHTMTSNGATQGTPALGTLTMHADGTYDFNVSNAAVQFLGQGDKIVQTYEVKTADGTATSTITITINGSNDAAVLSSASVALDETNAPLSTSGQLSISDVDSAATFQAQSNVVGAHGSFSIGTDGKWNYTANSANDNLNVGDSVSDTFTVKSADGTATSVTVTINGSNDAAVLSSASVALDETNAPLSTSGQLSISDVDSAATFQAQSNVVGAHGSFSIGTDGKWNYTANSANDNLNVGDSVSDTFTVKSADGTATSVTVTINGSNDAAVLSSASVALDETNAPLSTSGQLSISDVDSAATFQAQSNVVGAHGSFSIGTDGKWNYTANSANDNLNVGDSVSDTFTVKSADGTATSVTVTINGSNDAAVLSSASVALDETNAPLSTSGQLSISDVDSAATFQAQSNVVGAHGSFSIGTDGKWNYTANSANDNLNVGDSVSDTFTVKSADGTATSVTVTINGSNDAAVLSSASVALDETNAPLSTSGQLSISDVDSAATFQAQSNVVGAHGSFSIGSDGKWNYTANSANDNLNVGDSVSDTFTVKSADGTATSVTVTINGSNDAAVLSSASVALDETNAPLSTSGQLSISDVDSAATFQAQSNVVGAHGSFSIGTDGKWNYTANSANDNLNVGDSVSDTFTVKSADGTATSVTVTINGSNDAAVLSSASVALDETNAPLSTSGQLSISDVDSAATFQAQSNVVGAHGSFSIGSDGKWNYTANSANDNLNVGDSVSDTFTVKSADGTATSVTVTINGSNDAAVLSSASVALDETNAPLSTSGQLSISDVDSAATFQAQSNVVGAHGSFSIGTDGKWNYTANSANDNLNVGDSVSDTFTVKSADGTATSVTVTINGSNDAAVLSSASVALDETNAPLSTSGQLSISDVDSAATFQAQSNVVGAHGSFSIGSDGKWNYTANSANDNLNVGDSVSDTFTVKSADGTATSVTVTINGSNDAAVLSSASVALDETNAPLSTSGQLSISDVDSAATFQAQSNVVGAHGSFSIGTDGKWNYTANSANDNLNVGDSVSDTFTVKSADGTATSVTVTINGSNDAAVLSSASVALDETNAPLSTSGQLSISDVDSAATFQAQSNVVGAHGSFSIGTDGKWNYTANSANDNLNVGDSVSDTFTVKSADGTATSVTVTINGSNDAAVLSSASVALDETNAPLSTSGQLSISDVDSAATFQAQSNVVGAHGSFSIGTDGKWNYTANSANDNLNVGDSVSDTFTVKSADGTATSVTVTINGSNDAAVLSSASVALDETNAPLSTSGQLSISDVDSAATFQAQSNVVGAHGSFSIGTDGKWNYTANSANDNLNVGDSVSDTFTVKSADGTATSVTVTINGSNDAAVLSSASVALDETNAPLSTSGQLSISDVDSAATFQAQSNVVGAHGSFSIGTDGKWNYTANSANDNLNVGDSVSDTFTVKSADGTATSVTVTINGSNDAAVLSSASVALDETNAPLSTSGQLSISDVDSAATFQAQSNVVGAHGSFSIGSDGKWNYTANSANDNLNVGDSVSDTFTVKSADGTATSVTVTINGSNDAAVLSSASVALDETNAPLSTSGQLSISDVDSAATFQAQSNVVGAHGSFSIGTDGKWNYTANSANDNLNVGDSVSDTFTVKSADGTATSVTVTINGSNDAAVLSSASVALDETNAPLSTSGQLSISDVDSAATFQAQSNVVGAHGSFSIGSDGKWNYTANSANDNLNVGDSVSDTFTVKSADGTATSVTVTINGSNDAAVLSSASVALDETNAPLSTSGQLSISDVDSAATFQAQSNVVGAHGSFSIGTDGKWNYTANSANDNLNVGDSVSDTFTVKSADGTATSVTVTINGSNDAAVLSSASVALDETNAPLSTSGQLSISDVDSAATFQAQSNVVGAHGSFSIGSDGKWNYTANSANDNLNVGDSVSDTFTVKSADGTATSVTVTINGSNDAAVLSSASVALDETNAPLSTSGQLSISDVDSAATFQAQSNVVGAHGSFSIGTDGKWNYTANSANDNLNVGDSVSDTFTVKSADGTATSVTVTINGSNDAAVLSSASVALDETNAPLSTSGQLSISDVDSAATFQAQSNVVGAHGSFSIGSDGKWNYTANSANDNLNVGDSVSDTFTVKSADGTATSVTVTINGSNDAAVLSSASVALDETNAPLSTSGQLSISDVDSAATFQAQSNVVGAHGSFSIGSDGKWNYTANSANDNLNVGDSVSDTFTVKSADGTATSVTVTINGSNDAAVLSSASVALDETNAPLSTSGQLSISDVDSAATFQAQSNVVGAHGSFSIGTDGKWNYTANSANDNLNVGDSVSDTFTVKSADGTATSVTVTINGSNDAAVLSSASVALDETNAPLSTSGQLSISDVDSAATFQAQSNVVGAHGSFSIGTDGKWNYTANSANDNLNVGDSVSDTFTVKSADGTATSVTVTINGSNDAAVLSSASVALDETNAPLSTSGQLSISDVDSAATFQAQSNVVGAHGSFSIGSDGKWNYTANSANDNLNVGDSVSDTFTVKSADGTATSVTVTINGSNDAAVLSSASVALDETNAPLSTSGQLSISDVDSAATFQAQSNVVGAHGSFSIGTDGKWNYTANSANDNLNVGDSVSDTFTVKSADGTATSVTVTINGSNDAAVLSSASVALDETNAPLSTSGQLSISDVDSAATFQAQSNVVGAHGSFSIGSDGKWNYTANSANDNLNVGDSVSDTFTVKSADGTATSVTVTINGSNDAAVLSSASVALDETNAPLSTSGQLSISDVDSAATFQAQSNVVGAHGSFSIGTDGKWNYTANSANDNLNVGDSVSDTFTVKSADGTATSVTVTINGSNDAAVLSSASVALDETNAPLSTSGQLSISDVDSAATFQAQSNVVGAHGSFSIGSDGKWNYTANSANDNLNVGDSVSDTFTVKSADGTATSVTVTINGSNDAAVLSSASVALDETNAPLSTSGQLSISDVDSAATFQAQSNVVGAHGSFSIGTDGKWNYTANSANDNLNVGDSVSDTFTVKSADGTATSVTVTINGSNDAAVLSSASVALDETNAPLSTSGQLSISDVDSAATFQAQSNVVGAHGSFSIGSDGKWNYTANSANDNLNVGDSVSDTFTVKSADGTATSVTVTINGSNDAAVLSSASVALDETNAPLSTSGQLSISDVDSAATFQAQSNVVGAHGSFSIGTDGKWNYTANSANDNLNVGDSVSDTFTVKSADGTATSVTVTINGANDAPVISSLVQAGTVTEDGTLTVGGQVTATDVDHGAVLTYSGDATTANGAFKVNATTGEWSYTLANNQSLSASDHLTETFTVKVTDEQGATTTQVVTVTINGANDAPVISSLVQAGTVTEDGTLTVGGQVTATDVDHGAVLTYSGDATTANGAFKVNATTGEWSYTLANNQSLSASDHLTETFTVKVTDEQGATTTQVVTMTINGANDAPVISSLVQAGTVTEDGTLTVGGQVTATDVDHGAVLTYSGDATTANGAFKVNATTGEWSYTLANNQSLSASDHLTEKFTVTVTDEQGATTTQVVTMTINGANDAPVISSSQSSAVYESGLSTGTHPGAQSTVTSGSFNISDVDTGDHLTATIGGVTVVAGANIGTLHGSVHIDSFSGGVAHYTYTLTSASSKSPDSFVVDVSDSHTTTSKMISITIVDDAPIAIPLTNNGQMSSGQDTNLMITLDLSGSMGDPSGVGGMSKLELAKSSILELFEQYQAIGNVKVELVTFSDSATNATGAWVDVATAKSIVLALTSGGNTNYDAALLADLTAFGTSGKIAHPGVQNVSYFLSDGAPTANQDWPGSVDGSATGLDPSLKQNGIQAPEQAYWESFLNANEIKSYALGMGSAAVQSALDPIAYNGVGAGSSLNGVVVSDLSQLSSVLAATVHASPVSGEITGGVITANFGADGGHFQSIVVDGATYTYDATGTGTVSSTHAYTFDTTSKLLTVATHVGGSIAVDMDGANVGHYTYTPPATVSSALTETFGYTLVDGDGSTATSTLAITIDPALGSMVVRDDVVVTNQSVVDIPDWALLANDTGPNSAGQAITAATTAASGDSVTLHSMTNDTVHYVDATGTAAGGSFVYTDTAGAVHSNAQVTVVSDKQGAIDGTYLDEILIGGSGADTINGGAGKDILIGGAGVDKLNGGDGNDILVGGSGNDTLSGGLGADVFKWSLGDQSTSSAPAVDHITDFNTASIPNGGDVLDLRDLLQGEHSGVALQGTASSGSLDRFLKFEMSGSSLVLDVMHDATHSSAITQKIVLDNITGSTLDAAKLSLAHAVDPNFALTHSPISDADLLKKLVDTGHLKTDV